MTSPSDWTFCWKLNAPLNSTNSSSRSKRKRNLPQTQTSTTHQTGTSVSNSLEKSGFSIMDNIKLPSAETWSGVGMNNSFQEPKSKKLARGANQTHQNGNGKTQISPSAATTKGSRAGAVGRRNSLQAPLAQDDNQFIAGMMQRVEINLLPSDFMIQRNPDLVVIPQNQKSEDFNLAFPQPAALEDDSLALAATPESGNSNISGDEYSPAVTPVSSDRSFLHFLNDDSLSLEICEDTLNQEALYSVDVLPQELFNYDTSSWLSCFEP